ASISHQRPLCAVAIDGPAAVAVAACIDPEGEPALSRETARELGVHAVRARLRQQTGGKKQDCRSVLARRATGDAAEPLIGAETKRLLVHAASSSTPCAARLAAGSTMISPIRRSSSQP